MSGALVIAASMPLQAQQPSPEPSGPPVSLDRIRDGLRQEVTRSLLRSTDIPADFKIQILEQQKTDDLLSKMEIGKPGPRPFGGTALWEQNRRLFNPVDNPLIQPYAVFSPAELIDVTYKSLLFHYLGKAALQGAGALRDNMRKSAAQREVDVAIAEFCAQRPDRSDIKLCNPEP